MTPQALAAEIDVEIRGLAPATTDAIRNVRKRYSQRIKGEPAAFVLALALTLQRRHGRRWVGYELVRHHRAAFAEAAGRIEAFAEGLDSWDTVDAFGRILSGPAWLRGWIADDLIAAWAASPDRWLRRAALVSTVALNAKTDGGPGDAVRTLAICRALAADRDDMVEKALSWALRELLLRDEAAVVRFLEDHDAVLPARAKREVRHKLETGLKSPRRIK
ncbi:MAG TPA: DNA alkylation repair protein [Caulobacteraceae bacterium]|nr:DNA alkylation repair protein [Caulobacteraceae bacterium]